jgi:D-alanyl-D-alanine dipeptidase
MALVAVTETEFDVEIRLAYATADNLTGRPVYARPLCYLHRDAAAALRRAVAFARKLDVRLRVFDAFRPTEAQWRLWNHNPDPTFLADPRRGSPHSRGVAVDLTLLDRQGTPLDMGTPFDDFSDRAHHDNTTVPVQVQRNRFILLGLMSAAGWDFYMKEWWHYQLFNARSYPLYSDRALPHRMMDDE